MTCPCWPCAAASHTPQAEYDASYVCFSCITGTVGSVGYLQGADGSPWLRFTLRVPTPHSDSFTT